MLGIIKNELNSINVPYEFMRWTGDAKNAYVVGECSEIVTLTEDGAEEATMILNGFTRGAWLELETIKEKIKRHFPTVGGFRTSTTDGSVVISYDNSYPVPTGEADLKRIQINLNVKTWKGSI